MSSVIIEVYAKYRSSKSGVIIDEGGRYVVRVISSPHKGEANSELISLLSNYFKLPKRDFKIVQGFKSKYKRVKIG